MSTQPTDEEIRELWSQYNPLHGIQSFARSVLVNWGTPSGDALDLLEEVAACFTRDDDLPNELLPRIDAMLTARKEGKL